MDEHIPSAYQADAPHCTLCALGIPDHLGQHAPTPSGASASEPPDPVSARLQRRRLGLWSC